MSKLSEILENCKEKENSWVLANNASDYSISVDRNGSMSVTIPEHTVDITDSTMKYMQSSITTGSTSGSTSQVTTSNTTGPISSGYLTIDPNLIYNKTYITTTPYITQPSYNGFKIPSSVYTEDKVTRELLDSYANDSFIFDKDSKIMIYKDKNGDYFIQESFKRIEAEDVEKELISKKDASVLQSTVDEYFGK
jgi:hypothetical protein